MGPALLVAAAVLLAPLRAGALPGEDFGRWQRTLGRCSIQRAPAGGFSVPHATCRLLRLDQQMEGLLTVRFVLPDGGGALLDRQLVFAGVLEEGSAGMHCRQSRCEPRWPLQLRVSAVGQSGFRAMTSAMHLARAQLATGQCLLEARKFRCDATSAEGDLWLAEASP